MWQEDILDCMARAIIRGKIDLVCAYYQILMEIVDIHKTAFKTSFGMYEWLVMLQGLCNAVVMFQRYINWVLQDYIASFVQFTLMTLRSSRTRLRSMQDMSS